MHPTEAQAGRHGRLWRLFWIGAAVILGVAAAIAIAAVLSGTFSSTDGKILLTLAVLFFAGSTALAGLALLERGQLGRLGAVIVAVSPIGFALIVAALWIERSIAALDRSATTAALLLLAGLLVATGRLLARSPRASAAFVGTTVSLTIAEAITFSAVWRNNPGSGTAKAAATFWILTALGYFLIPILQRLEVAPPGAARTVAAPTLWPS